MASLKVGVFDRRLITLEIITSLVTICSDALSKYLPVSSFMVSHTNEVLVSYGCTILSLWLGLGHVNIIYLLVCSVDTIHHLI